ncbi:MAG TPA: hypothetical protein VEC39_15850 [Vicinamibacterales bacterium]|nr:hypothetical protein [Vicinamibacterales bacterium]
MVLSVVIAACGACSAQPPSQPAVVADTPKDPQHAGITTPHGDHSPHHGGLVMMNGETHYEVVFDKGGAHRVWFTNAVREDLPASIASAVVMVIARPGGPAETVPLQIDENGESWIANGKPLAGGETVTLTYSLRGEPFEIEIPVPVASGQ